MRTTRALDTVSYLPGFFAALGVRLLEGRDFDDNDRANSEPVVIVSKTLADRMFPHEDPLNRHIVWTDPITKFINISQSRGALSAWPRTLMMKTSFLVR